MRLQAGQLSVNVSESRAEMGKVAGAAAATHIKELLKAQPEVAVIFASAPSQIEALAALRADPEVEWHRVTAFHMDEYVGMPETHPASFRRFLKQHLFDHVKVKAFYGLSGEAPDATAECARYAALLEEHSPQFVILGIGENGHLAFNDPPVADFNDPLLVKEVTLDEVCRHQQVHDGAFPTLDAVPRTALTLTVPALMRIPRVIAVVPGPMKKHAVKAALEGPIETACPASILRTHTNATLFLDHDSASLL